MFTAVGGVTGVDVRHVYCSVIPFFTIFDGYKYFHGTVNWSFLESEGPASLSPTRWIALRDPCPWPSIRHL